MSRHRSKRGKKVSNPQTAELASGRSPLAEVTIPDLDWPDPAPVLTADDVEARPLSEWLRAAFKKPAAQNVMYRLLVAYASRMRRLTKGYSLTHFLQDENPSSAEQASMWNSALREIGYDFEDPKPPESSLARGGRRRV